MIEQFHKVHFIFDQNEQSNTLNTYHNIEIISNRNELYAKDGGGDFSLYLGNSYLSLDFDTESKRIGNFGGAINLSDISAEHITPPKNIVNGILYVCDKIEFMRGGGWRIEFMEKYVFDAKQSLFQIGVYNANEPCCRFLKNAYCQLDPLGSLKCILISNIVIK